MKQLKVLNFIVLSFLLLQCENVYAYLDPGSGSILLQAFIGTLAVAGGAISMFWGKVTAFFKKQSLITKDEKIDPRNENESV